MYHLIRKMHLHPNFCLYFRIFFPQLLRPVVGSSFLYFKGPSFHSWISTIASKQIFSFFSSDFQTLLIKKKKSTLPVVLKSVHIPLCGFFFLIKPFMICYSENIEENANSSLASVTLLTAQITSVITEHVGFFPISKQSVLPQTPARCPLIRLNSVTVYLHIVSDLTCAGLSPQGCSHFRHHSQVWGSRATD